MLQQRHLEGRNANLSQCLLFYNKFTSFLPNNGPWKLHLRSHHRSVEIDGRMRGQWQIRSLTFGTGGSWAKYTRQLLRCIASRL